MSGRRRPSSNVLARRLASVAAMDSEYWDFVNRDEREHVHGLLHYPAMMVPRLQRELLETCIRWDPSIRLIRDPFVGSGTVLTEAMLLGRDFVGQDLNPLAILACRVKAECPSPARLRLELNRVLAAATADTSEAVEAAMPNLDKWFERHVQVGLSRLRRAVCASPSARTRRFFWVVLAETVRLSSNSRTSTAKLHLRPQCEIRTRPSPTILFAELAKRNIHSVIAQRDLLLARGLLERGRYVGRCELRVADARAPQTKSASLLMTSPPYGDNHTTIAYGQASYLPLRWIPAEDIPDQPHGERATSIRGLDTASLGGSWQGAFDNAEQLLDRSLHLRQIWDALAHQPRDRRLRVAAYFRDLDESLTSILGGLQPGSLMLWTVADRSVGGTRVPLTAAIPELMGDRAELVTAIHRTIPAIRKSMPTHNSVSDTMRSETVLVMRTTGGPG
ncbi:site-specific DNA-methyltransferase [soil metagenome]